MIFVRVVEVKQVAIREPVVIRVLRYLPQPTASRHKTYGTRLQSVVPYQQVQESCRERQNGRPLPGSEGF